MKYFNALVAVLMGMLIFMPTYTMDQPEPSEPDLSISQVFYSGNKGTSTTPPISEVIANANECIKSDSQNYALEDLKNSLNQNQQLFLRIAPISFNRIINYQSEAKAITNKEVQDLKEKIYQDYLKKNPGQVCHELTTILQSLNPNKEMNSYYKQDIATLFPFLQQEKSAKNYTYEIDNFDIMFNDISDTTTVEAIADLKDLLSDICDNTKKTFSKQVDKIVGDNFIQNNEKMHQLSELYKNFVRTKPETDNKTAWKLWLKVDGEIKKAYNALKLTPTKKEPVPEGQIPWSESTQDMTDIFNELNKSTLFEPEETQLSPEELSKPEEIQLSPDDLFKNDHQSFIDSSQYLLDNLNSLKSAPGKKVKKDLIDNLDRMNIFIRTYDLNVKEQEKQEKPSDSFRCWLLTLIRKAIINLDSFTTDQIVHWKNEIDAIEKTTQESLKQKTNPLFNSELHFIAILEPKKSKEKRVRVQRGPLSATEKENRDSLERTLPEQEEKLKKNIFDKKLLTEYRNNLQEYQKLLLQKEKKLRQNTSEKIKIASKKIQQCSVIAPRKRSDEENAFRTLLKKEPTDLSDDALETMNANAQTLYEKFKDEDCITAQKMQAEYDQFLQNISEEKDRRMKFKITQYGAYLLEKSKEKQEKLMEQRKQAELKQREEKAQRAAQQAAMFSSLPTAPQPVIPTIEPTPQNAIPPREETEVILNQITQYGHDIFSHGMKISNELRNEVANPEHTTTLLKYYDYAKRMASSMDIHEATMKEIFINIVISLIEEIPLSQDYTTLEVSTQQQRLRVNELQELISVLLESSIEQQPAQPISQAAPDQTPPQPVQVEQPVTPPTIGERIASGVTYVWQGFVNIVSTIASTIRSLFSSIFTR